MSTTTSKTQPALIGGLVIGVLSALPLVYAANCCCCLWIVGGGMLSAYLLQQNSVGPITQSDAAITGLLAGLIGAFVYLVVSIPVTLIFAPMERQVATRILENARDLPPVFREMMNRSIPWPVALVFNFALQLMLGAIFATLGGLLGAVFFRKALPPAGDASSSL